jgi:NitT/TauT family transport system permease protein
MSSTEPTPKPWTTPEGLFPIVLTLLPAALLFALWELLSRAQWVDPMIISRPSWLPEVFVAQLRQGVLWEDLEATLREFLAGYSLAVGAGVPLGLMAGWYRRLEYLLEPAIWFWYNAPIVAFYPLLILWLGLGSPTIIALAFLLAFVPIYINTFTGMRAVSPQLVQCARSFGCSTLGIFVHVALPGSIPAVIAGLRLGVGRALIGVVIGELIGGNAGLGYRMAYASNRMNASLYFVALLMTAALGLIMTELLRRLENRTTVWRV